jgi:hypothetical protein
VLGVRGALSLVRTSE